MWCNVSKNREVIGTNENKPRVVADSTRTLPSVVENMASLARIHFENYPSFWSPWGIWCNLRLKKDRDENPLGLKVCLRSTDEAEIEIAVVRKGKRRGKITSRFRHGGLRLVRFVLQSTIMVKSSWDDAYWIWNYDLLLYLKAIINIVGTMMTPFPRINVGVSRWPLRTVCSWYFNIDSGEGGTWYRPNTFDHDCVSYHGCGSTTVSRQSRQPFIGLQSSEIVTLSQFQFLVDFEYSHILFYYKIECFKTDFKI